MNTKKKKEEEQESLPCVLLMLGREKIVRTNDRQVCRVMQCCRSKKGYENRRERERERDREEEEWEREECAKAQFMFSKKRSGGPLRERHSTCRHMVSLAHHPNPTEYEKIHRFIIIKN